MATWTKAKLRRKIEVLRQLYKNDKDPKNRKIYVAQAKALKNALALKELNESDLGGDPEVRRIAKAFL